MKPANLLEQPSTYSTSPRSCPFARLITVISTVYAVGLVGFLIARVLFGDRWWLAMLANLTPFYFAPLLLLFPLALLARSKWGLLLLLPLAAAGLITYGRYFLPPEPIDAAGAPSVRVIAFNVSNKPRPLDPIEAWLREQPADLVLLQELPAQWEGLLRLRDLYPYIASHQMPNASAVLSRYPIIATEGFNVGERGFPYAPRAVIDVGGQAIVVYNASLPAPFRSQGRLSLHGIRSRRVNAAWDLLTGYDENQRDQELQNLLARADAETLPTILGGDFNVSDQSREYALLAERYHDSFRERGIGFGWSYPAVQAFGVPPIIPAAVRIDYIWHSDGLQTVSAEQGPFVSSDHLPLIAEVALTPR